jgi:hypothetical protein
MALCSNCGHDKGTGSYCGACGQRSAATNPPPPQYQAPPQYQQPQYQPPQYQQQQYGVPQYSPRTGGSGLAIASMVLGIVGVVFAFFCYPVGIVCALVGLPLGIVARSNIAKGTAPASSNGQAVTGIVLSVIAVPISLIMMFALSGAGYYY